MLAHLKMLHIFGDFGSGATMVMVMMLMVGQCGRGWVVGRRRQIWKVSLDLDDFRSAKRDLYLRSIQNEIILRAMVFWKATFDKSMYFEDKMSWFKGSLSLVLKDLKERYNFITDTCEHQTYIFWMRHYCIEVFPEFFAQTLGIFVLIWQRSVLSEHFALVQTCHKVCPSQEELETRSRDLDSELVFG